jgi:hypothetical protein
METNTIYGWDDSGNNLDTHLIKNSEWGAVAYLTQSTYGKNAEVWINNDSTYTTGCAGTGVSVAPNAGCQNVYNIGDGTKASTTGTIYGIYDMSGGAWERTSAYFTTGSSSLTTYGSNIINAEAKYKDTYVGYSTNIDDRASSLASKGEGLYETSVGAWYDGVAWQGSQTSWYTDYSLYPYSPGPWFLHGGAYSDGAHAGVFGFSGTVGNAYSSYSFRSVILVGAGL